jgi:hypothetical protein
MQSLHGAVHAADHVRAGDGHDGVELGSDLQATERHF